MALLLVTVAAAIAGEKVRSVYVMRHCIRAVDPTALVPYAARPFPTWGAGIGKDDCLPRGLRIYEAFGRQIAASGLAPAPVSLVADNFSRTVDSAKAFARGLGLPESAVAISGTAFSHCAPPSATDKDRSITSRLRSVPRPDNSSELLRQIDTVLCGKKSIAAQKNVAQDGKLKGAVSLASTAADVFLMEYGGGITVGWGEVVPREMYRFLEMQVEEPRVVVVVCVWGEGRRVGENAAALR